MALQDLINATGAGGTCTPPGGIYRESFSINSNITLNGSSGAVEVRGSDVWTSFTGSGPWTSTLTVPSFTRADLLDGNYYDTTLGKNLEQVFYDSVAQTRVTGTPAAGQFNLDGSRHVILGSNPSGHTIEVTTRQTWGALNTSGATVTGVTFRHCADAPNVTRGIGSYQVDTQTYTFCNFYDAHGNAVSPDDCDNVTIDHCTFTRCGCYGIGGYGSNWTISNNTVTECGKGGYNWWGNDAVSGGIKVVALTNSTVHDNLIHDVGGPGLWFDLNCGNVEIYNNTIYNTGQGGNYGGACIMYEVSTVAGTRIHDNDLWSPAAGGNFDWRSSCILMSTSSNAEIDHNVCYLPAGGRAHGISVGEEGSRGPVQGISIHDNTIIIAAEASGSFSGSWAGPTDWGLVWLWDGNGTSPYTGLNSAADNQFWWPHVGGSSAVDSSAERWQWTSAYATIAGFSATSGGATSTYMTDAAKDAAVTALGGADTTAPIISAKVATPSQTGATITWTTDEMASSQVAYAVGTLSDYAATVLATSGLVAYWQLSEVSGNTAADADGNTYPGTWDVTPTQGVSGITGANGRTAVTLSGSEHVTIADAAGLDLADTFSIEAWVKRSATQGANQGILSKGSGAYYLRLNSSNQLNLIRSQTADIVSSSVTITDTTTWHHVVGTKSGATLHLYVDGSESTGSVSNSTMADNANVLNIGSDQGGERFSGSLQDVALYSTVLSPTTVSAHYTAGTSSFGGTLTTETDTAPRVLSHSVVLSGLSTSTTYGYRVLSRDAAMNLATSSDATFTTLGIRTASPIRVALSGGASASRRATPVTLSLSRLGRTASGVKVAIKALSVVRRGALVKIALSGGLSIPESGNFPAVSIAVSWTTGPSAVPQWIDIATYARDFSVRRGRQFELDRFQAGAAQIRLENQDRRFDPTYTAGAYYPNVKPMKRLRIQATWAGVAYPVFTGFVESWPQAWSLNGRLAEVNLPVVDGFAVFGNAVLNGTYTEQPSGARIDQVLTDAGWGYEIPSHIGTDTIGAFVLAPVGDRAIAVGQSTLGAIIVENQSALEHLQAVNDSENGQFFIARDGTATFNSRQLAIRTSVATFGDTSADLPYMDYTFEEVPIRNEARFTSAVTRNEAVAADAASQIAYFRRSDVRGGFLQSSDSELASLASWMVNRYKDPVYRVRSILINPRRSPVALWPVLLDLEIGDCITIKRQPPGGTETITQISTIEGIEHDVTPDQWLVRLWLSQADTNNYLILNDSTVGKLNFGRLGY